jgi:ABC-type transport system substrate-binding protein
MVLPLRQDPPGGWDVQQAAQRFDIVNAGAPVWGVGNLVRECADNQSKACPGLAESWEVNSDFTQFTYKIRDNVLWHDGKPFTAEDAKFWLELVVFGAESGDKKRPPAFWSKDFGTVQKVEALPGNRVRVTLKEAGRVVLNTMNIPIYHVAHPRHLAEPLIKQGEVRVTPQDLGWIGTGPFKMVKYEKGSRALVQRFDRYWEKDAQGRQLPYLDGIEFALMRDPSAMHAAIRVGRMDGGTRAAGYYLTREQKAGYVKDLGDKVWFAELVGSNAIGLGANPNLLRPGPLQDVRVR